MPAMEERDDFNEESPESMNDLRLEMKIKNNVLWKAIHKKFESVAEFCRAHKTLKFKETDVGRLINFKISPFTEVKRGDTWLRVYRSTCLSLEKALKLPVEQLFPEELYGKLVGIETSKAIEVKSFNALPSPEKQKIMLLTGPEENLTAGLELSELKERISEVLDTLPYRQREILKMRYGIPDGVTYTLEELGRVFKLTKERIRSIEAEALRKLQNPIRSEKLESLL